jgi:Cytochrome c7 and related cytochrome c
MLTASRRGGPQERAMPQIFHRSFNTISRLTIYGAVFIAAALSYVAVVVARSSLLTNVGTTRSQPVPFSHEHHVKGLGLDCRFCHDTADKSSFAGMPATKVCMNCHQQIQVGSDMLEPVRDSYKNDKSLRWERVHKLADFVYFNHSVHVNKGVGCTTCHGPVSDMPLMWQHGTLLMEWCLDCHREPNKYVRPRDQVYEWDYQPPANQDEEGRKLMAEYGIKSLTHCSTCHR